MSGEWVLPIYVDTNALLDLLASIEGGFSIVEKVTTRTTTTSATEKSVSTEAGTEFGIPNVLNLLKIKLSGSLGSKKQQEAGEQKEAVRYHTYGSLLHRLRTFLSDEALIRRLDEDESAWETVVSSDFVEIRGVFRPNPLVDSLERIDRLMGIFEILGSSIAGSKMSSKKKGKGGPSDKKMMKEFRQFIRGILSDIERGNTRIFIVDAVHSGQFKAVVLLFTDYLRDPTMTEIAHKEYRLLGKVVRKIEEGSQETIDLLRGTGLGGVGREALEELWGTLNQMEGMNLPEVRSEIGGRALEVVPIAIFV